MIVDDRRWQKHQPFCSLQCDVISLISRRKNGIMPGNRFCIAFPYSARLEEEYSHWRTMLIREILNAWESFDVFCLWPLKIQQSILMKVTLLCCLTGHVSRSQKTYRTSKMQIPSDLILLKHLWTHMEAENKTFCSSTLLLDGLMRHELKHIKTLFASRKPRAAAPLIRQGASRSCGACILICPITWLRGHARTGGNQECGRTFSGRRWIWFTLIYDIFKKKWDEMSNTMNSL